MPVSTSTVAVPIVPGSHIRKVRKSSLLSMNHWRRSAMVLPGNTPTPPVITRVGMPSVWESTAWMMRVVLMVCPRVFQMWSRRSAIALGEGSLGIATHDLSGRRRQGAARRPAQAALAAGDVHRELDRLDELGTRVPTQQRVEVA